jgi:hypothetical protein
VQHGQRVPADLLGHQQTPGRVEVADLPGGTAVRDSKDPAGPVPDVQHGVLVGVDNRDPIRRLRLADHRRMALFD